MSTKKGDVIDVQCPKLECREYGIHTFEKSWRITGRGRIQTEIQIFKCSACRRKWRRGRRVNQCHTCKKTKALNVNGYCDACERQTKRDLEDKYPVCPKGTVIH